MPGELLARIPHLGQTLVDPTPLPVNITLNADAEQ